MHIHVKVRGHTVSFFPEAKEEFDLELPESQSIRAILAGLGVNPHLIMGVIVDGTLRNKDYVPADGATVILLSPPSGG